MVAADDAGNMEGVRQRRRPTDSLQETPPVHGDGAKEEKAVPTDNCKLQTDTYWLTRIVLLRYVGFIYLVAFLVALTQNSALLGSRGLLPADKYLRDLAGGAGPGLWQRLSVAPTLLWLVDIEDGMRVDVAMETVAWVGVLLSGLVVLLGCGNWPAMLALWALYHSLVNVGQRWYSFGWESQLLETGFLVSFLCPVWQLTPLPRHTPTPTVVILGLRWLIFRIMLGAGLIKIRGDRCWRDLTCMNYHYETQPVPNPVSWYLHQSPEVFHKFETLTNHVVELVAPLLLLAPRRLRMVGGAIQILFQVVLIISGNLSFLNWLTILPSLACFDDATLQWLFPRQRRAEVAALQRSCDSSKSRQPLGVYMRRVFNLALGVLLAYLSVPVVQNLLSSRQAMNTSFHPLRLVNTYGAFGSVTKTRTEVIFQGTWSPDPRSASAEWREYQFKCKPGNVSRTPCLVSPFHYRLDWLLWFAAFQDYQHNPWLIHLAAKLLANDPLTESLLAYNPFHGMQPPRYIRVEHYRYRYTKFGSGDSDWWRRKHLGSYLPPVSLDSLRPLLSSMGWPVPQPPPPP